MCASCHSRFASMKVCPLCTKFNQRFVEKVLLIKAIKEVDNGKDLCTSTYS